MVTQLLVAWALAQEPSTAVSANQPAGACAHLARFTSLQRLSARRPAAASAPDIQPADPSGVLAGTASNVAVLADALLGDEADALCDPERELPAATLSTAARRDRTAYQLLSIGYSAREVADIISGRISRRALDHAQRMLMAGRKDEDVADYLDAQYRATPGASPVPMPPPPAASLPADRWARAVDRHARAYGVDPALVRAVMMVESGNNPRARSPAGAIGLMQLMPLTARALRVDPWQPEQNIEGGVRYLAQLLGQFGHLETALIAYNGGPGYAQRYANGRVALYGETRAYVARIRQLLAR